MKQSFLERLIINPVVPKVIIGLYIILVFADIITPFVDKDVKYEIGVMPASQNEDNPIIFSDYPQASVQTKGKLEIKNPTITDRLIFRTSYTPALTTLLAYLTILILLFRNTRLFLLASKEFSFRKSMWKQTMIIGLILILFAFVNMAKEPVASRIIAKYSNGEFKKDETFVHWLQMWSGLLLIFLGTAFKKATDLQQEQDLTV